MRVFLKSLYQKVWHLVKQMWIKPETPSAKWNKDNAANCNWNNKV